MQTKKLSPKKEAKVKRDNAIVAALNKGASDGSMTMGIVEDLKNSLCVSEGTIFRAWRESKK